MELGFAGRNGQERGGIVSDARTGKRFPLELPIKIHKEEAGEHAGMTGNLSAAGVYIKADAALESGSNVEFEIALPPEMTGAKDSCQSFNAAVASFALTKPDGRSRRRAWRSLRD